MIIKLNYRLIAVICAVLLVCIAFGGEQLYIKATASAQEGVRLPVIMYHQILKAENRIGDYVITPAQFENDLKYIKENGYSTVTLEDIEDYAEHGAALPEKPIFITFDDGYETAYHYALPILKKYDMNAVVSIIGKQSEKFSSEPQPHHLSYSHLSWEQLRELEASGVFEIGNHTYDMHGNKRASRFGCQKKKGESVKEYQKAISDDIGSLNKKLEQELGHRINLFAYPFGAISKESREIVAQLGFKVILTCEEKANYIMPFCDKPLALNRFNRAGRYSTAEFFNKLEK